MIRIGIIGLGNHAEENLIPSILLTNGITLEAVSSRSSDKLLSFKSRYPIKETYSDWQAMIENPNIDAVVVSATPDIHFKSTLTAIKNKKHIFVEKPPANDLDELNEIRALLNTCPSISYFVGYNFIYSETYIKLKEIVQREGKIKHANIKFISSKPRELFWNCQSVTESYFMTTAIHAFSIIYNLFGDIVKYNFQYTKLKDHQFSLVVNLFCKDGNATLNLGNYSNKFEYTYELINENGGIGILENQNHFYFSNIASCNIQDETIFKGKQVISYEYPALKGGYDRTGYTKEFQDFVLQTKAPSFISIDMSICIYKLMHDIISDISKETLLY